MILIALINVCLILFDFSYFWLRPHIREYYPEVVYRYDPIKGVTAHPLTQKFRLEGVNWFAFAAEADPVVDAEDLINRRAHLRETITIMAENNPFADSGQSANLRAIFDSMRTYNTDGDSNAPIDSSPDAPSDFSIADLLPDLRPADGEVEEYWTVEDYQRIADDYFFSDVIDNPEEAERRRAHFKNEIQPLLSENYLRQRTRSGEYVDFFIYIDAPFLALFLVEFLVRWVLAVRRKEYIRWWLFPVYYWYDVLGLIPIAELRFFRLFRIISIYVRLYKSDLTSVGDDMFSRLAKRFYTIISEEISDMVAIRILSEMQDEIKSGSSIDVYLNALEPRRSALKDLAVKYAERFTEKRPGMANAENMLAESLDKAARDVPSLKMVPDFLKVRLTREIGLAVFRAINESLARSMRGDSGRETIGDVVDFILDDMMREGRESEINRFYQQVAVDVLENVKGQVAVKKWSQSDKAAAGLPQQPNDGT